MTRRARVVAHANFALAKYWGKADEVKMLPATPSISLTLDQLYTETTVELTEDPSVRSFSIDGKETENPTLSRYCDLLRERLSPDTGYRIQTHNQVGISMGLGSSASAYCSLAGAFWVASGRTINLDEISRLARLGSISASRSVYPGFVLLDLSVNVECTPVMIKSHLPPFDVVSIIVDRSRKIISSRDGMKRAMTSPEYESWLRYSKESTAKIKHFIYVGDLPSLGAEMESNFSFMDQVNQTSTPSFSYLNEDSLKVVAIVKSLREKGLSLWYTFDAGPNPFIICRPEVTETLETEVLKLLPDASISRLSTGPGLEVTVVD